CCGGGISMTHTRRCRAHHSERLVGVPSDWHGCACATETAATGAVLVRHRKGSRTMDWSDSPEQAAFRKEVREFIKSELPERYRAGDDGGEGFEGGWQGERKSDVTTRRDTAMQWADALSKRGLIAPAWPKEL